MHVQVRVSVHRRHSVCLCAPVRGRQARLGGALSLSVLCFLCECGREAVSDTLV